MDSKLPLLGSDGTNEQDEYCQKPAISSQQSRLISGLKLALYLSGVLNFMLGLQCLYLIRRGPIREGTLYAGLTRNVPIPWTVYSESNEWNNSAAIDQEWDELHVDDLGIIALPDTYVERMSLPPARRFPWDETKGVYLLNSYHNLHCLLYLRTAIMEFSRGESITHSFPHLNHCLEALRQDIICNADDTPRWVGSHIPSSGAGQYRMCRDWNQLKAWAKQNSACFKDIDTNNKDERFSFCPRNSPYAEKIIEMFGSINHLQEV